MYTELTAQITDEPRVRTVRCKSAIAPRLCGAKTNEARLPECAVS